MSVSQTIRVELREDTGSRKMKRLRNAGKTPAVIYGHGEDPVHLALSNDQVAQFVKTGQRVVQLTGGVSEQAFIRDVQWNWLGNQVLHVDFTRVSSQEKVEATVAIELRGDAPGTHAGGVVEQPLHEVAIECPASQLIEKIEVNINELELGQQLTVADLQLPASARALVDATQVVVQCVEPTAAPETEEIAALGGAEPEVIGKESEDEAGE